MQNLGPDLIDLEVLVCNISVQMVQIGQFVYEEVYDLFVFMSSSVHASHNIFVLHFKELEIV